MMNIERNKKIIFSELFFQMFNENINLDFFLTVFFRKSG